MTRHYLPFPSFWPLPFHTVPGIKPRWEEPSATVWNQSETTSQSVETYELLLSASNLGAWQSLGQHLSSPTIPNTHGALYHSQYETVSNIPQLTPLSTSLSLVIVKFQVSDILLGLPSPSEHQLSRRLFVWSCYFWSSYFVCGDVFLSEFVQYICSSIVFVIFP